MRTWHVSDLLSSFTDFILYVFALAVMGAECSQPRSDDSDDTPLGAFFHCSWSGCRLGSLQN